MGLDLSLLVELQQLEHRPAQELLVIDVAQMEATNGLVGLHQFQRAERQLVVPGLRHGQQVLLLACNTVSCTWNNGRQNRLKIKQKIFTMVILYQIRQN